MAPRGTPATRPPGSRSKSSGGCGSYQLRPTEFARYQLLALPAPILDTLLDCINELIADPYRDPHLHFSLVVPLYRIFPDAYLCGDWAIAYLVADPDMVVIEAVGQSFYRP